MKDYIQPISIDPHKPVRNVNIVPALAGAVGVVAGKSLAAAATAAALGVGGAAGIHAGKKLFGSDIRTLHNRPDTKIFQVCREY